MKQHLVLEVIVNSEVFTYGVQALFTFGTKIGETTYQKWSKMIILKMATRRVLLKLLLRQR